MYVSVLPLVQFMTNMFRLWDTLTDNKALNQKLAAENELLKIQVNELESQVSELHSRLMQRECELTASDLKVADKCNQLDEVEAELREVHKRLKNVESELSGILADHLLKRSI